MSMSCVWLESMDPNTHLKNGINTGDMSLSPEILEIIYLQCDDAGPINSGHGHHYELFFIHI